MIDELVPWEDFRPVLETVWRKPKRERKSTAGRKPWDAVLMFKAVVLGRCTICRTRRWSMRSGTG